MKLSARILCVIAGFAAPAVGQSFNIDVGSPIMAGPSSTYGAAGSTGVWNVVLSNHVTPFMTGPHPDDVFLDDVNGNPTQVRMHQFGGMDNTQLLDPALSGDDANLMNDALITHSVALESCMYLNGLEDGMYEVLVYAWMPSEPTIVQKVRFDFHPGFELVVGAWPGQHEEGVTYSRHEIEVVNGFMGFHVGIPAGGNTLIGSAYNGLQIRPLGQNTPTVSDWGVLIMVLLTLSTGTVAFRWRTAG